MARFDNGWIKIYRSLFEGDIPQHGLFTAGVFVRLLLMANWKESKACVAGKQVIIKPGQVLTGLRDIAYDEKEDPHLNKVRRSLSYLSDTGRIQQEITSKGRLITICNWDVYQKCDEGDLDEFTNRPQADHKLTTNRPQLSEEDKKERRKNTREALGAIPELAGIEIHLQGVKQSVQKLWLETYPDVEWIKREVLKAVAWKKNKGGEIKRPGVYFGNWFGNATAPIQKSPPAIEPHNTDHVDEYRKQKEAMRRAGIQNG